MAIGLAVSDVVNVQVVLAPTAIPLRNFGTLLILGPSDIIDVSQRMRSYSTLTQVAADFGTTLPEYYAAQVFFSQNPTPANLYIGRWAQNGSSGILRGGVFSGAAQASLLTSLVAISTGSMTVSVDGSAHTLSGLNFTSSVSLNGVAGIIGTALPSATVTWDSVNGRFNIESKTTGTNSSVSYATPSGSGTDISSVLALTSGTASAAPIAGIAAETPVSCVSTLAGLRNDWYGVTFAPVNSGDINATQYLAVAAYVQAAVPQRILGITTMDANTGSSTSTTDLAYQLKQLNYSRTFLQYSSSNPYAVCSFFARNFTVDFTANNSMITMFGKTEPGLQAETLSETFAATLTAKNCNYFVNYSNGAAIVQPGVMSSGDWFDVIYGTDWYGNAVQTALFNALYTTTTKIPQTDAGQNQLVAVVESVGDQAVNNGLIAPGVWNGPPLGVLNTGNAMPKGYYTYTIPMSQQSQSARNSRVAPTIQQAIKLAGAIQSVNAIITVNQ